MKSFLYFDTMITPNIITFVYWLLLLGAVFSGLGVIFGGYERNILGGLGIILGGAIGARISCELLIVLFKIHENLQALAGKSEADPD